MGSAAGVPEPGPTGPGADPRAAAPEAEFLPTAQHPTALRIILGSHLRRLREGVGVTPERAAHAIRASPAKISRLELGRVGLKARDVVDLLVLYGVTSTVEHRRWLELVEQANSPGWWQSYSDVLPGWFETYLRLEQSAAVIRTFEAQFVPGLLQTADYARAVIGHGDYAAPEMIDRRVRVRVARQQMLERPGGPALRAILDEATLHRCYGSREVQRGQIDHLLRLGELRSVSLQVLPFDRGGHAAAGGPFSLLRFAEPELPDIVYLEQLTGSIYLDKRTEVCAYTQVMDRIDRQAATWEETRDLLCRLRKEI